MRPEVISNETENCNPYVGFYPIFLSPGLGSIRCAFEIDGDDGAGQSGKETHSHVAPCVELIVQLEGHQNQKAPDDPKGAVEQKEDLRPPLGGI